MDAPVSRRRDDLKKLALWNSEVVSLLRLACFLVTFFLGPEYTNNKANAVWSKWCGNPFLDETCSTWEEEGREESRVRREQQQGGE